MKPPLRLLLPLFAPLSVIPAFGAEEEGPAWWDAAWTQRQEIVLDAGAAGLTDAAGDATVLVRLSDANFAFAAVREDGSDLRFVAADGKTVLAHQVESFDNLLNEAFVWVKVPGVESGSRITLHLYSGNTGDALAAGPEAKEAYDADTALVYHFAGVGTAPADTTGNGNNAPAAAATSEGALAGNGLRLSGNAVEIPNSTSLEWKEGQAFTASLWIKPAALQDDAVVFSRGGFQLLLDQGAPVVKLGAERSNAGEPVAAAAWSHLAVVADGTDLKVFLNGGLHATLEGRLPASTEALALGAAENGFAGEVDEFVLSGSARSAGWVKLAAVNQGPGEAAARVLAIGGTEAGGDAAGDGGGHTMQHLMLFGDIAKNMMFDGWIAIGVCIVMIIVGWTVAVRKFLYLNSIEKGTKLFLERWKSLSTDLTSLDPGDSASVTSLGGKVDADAQALLHKSPLFHIYQIGSDEIRHRLEHGGAKEAGLNGRSIQAIRASLDAGLVHESHRLSDGLVYLTISIAGGPYVGLLGTVMGVMITFAIIAKSGEVNVNSIAPGIAPALLATVVGLVVAIPALFIYSYLNGRIKNSLGLMQVFIDEFVAKMAEFHRPAGESDYTGGTGH
ncbi:MAG: DUF2341 domain-containing protein [Burkholderiaceae bacterium]